MLILMVDYMFNPPENIKNMNDGGQQIIVMMKTLLEKMEEAGMKAPSVSGEKAQFLISKYVYPELSIWDEDFEDKHASEFKDFENRRKNSKLKLGVLNEKS